MRRTRCIMLRQPNPPGRNPSRQSFRRVFMPGRLAAAASHAARKSSPPETPAHLTPEAAPEPLRAVRLSLPAAPYFHERFTASSFAKGDIFAGDITARRRPRGPPGGYRSHGRHERYRRGHQPREWAHPGHGQPEAGPLARRRAMLDHQDYRCHGSASEGLVTRDTTRSSWTVSA